MLEQLKAPYPANESPVKNIPRFTSTAAGKVRNVLYVLVGVAALILKKHYAGPGEQLIYNYGGNIAASFAVYFVFLQAPVPALLKKLRKPFAAGLALAVVELFEAFDGFGVMTNTYDPYDFFANALGVGLALVVDTTLHFRTRASLARDGVRED